MISAPGSRAAPCPRRTRGKLLADLRKQHAEQVAKIAPTKSKHDSAQTTLKDPAAKREALISEVPGAPQVVDHGR